MPTISIKGRQMPSSPIRKLVPLSEKAKKSGIKVLHLNIGQPDIKTPKQALDAVKNADIDVLAYSQTNGSEVLRKKIAAYYGKKGMALEPHQILVTTGGSEALTIAMGTLLDPGDEIIIPEPFYANYNGFATANGIKVQPVAATLETNFALPPISTFEERINARTKAILICNPNNPTGYLYTHDEIKQLANLAKTYDLFLIADEVYREFAYDGQRHYSILNAAGLDAHAVVIDSVSKRYSMCGARVGCIVSKNTAVMDAALKFAQARLSPPTMALMASEAALDTPDSYFETVMQAYVQRRDVLVRELRTIEGVRVARPNGAFYCMAELPVADAEDFAKWLLSDFNVDGETVMVAPAAGFYATQGLGKNQVRIAYVLHTEKLIRAVGIIAKGLKAYSN